MLVNKKIFESRIELILRNLRMDEEDQENTLSYILEKKGNSLACMELLGDFYETKASKSLLIDKDIEAFKKDMYVYAKLSVLGSDRRGVFLGDRLSFFGMLMSNHTGILHFMIKNIDYVAYEEKKDQYIKSQTYRFLSRTILLALKGEWEAVLRRAEIYLGNPSKDSNYNYTYLEFIFLKALAEKDVETMKAVLHSMLDIKVARSMLRNTNVTFDFYLHIFVLIYAKIALYHGFDLEIDCEMAPKELIDNTPAREYQEPYDFMKRFDFNTMTMEDWEYWIYEYHPDIKELEEAIQAGYFV